MIVVDANILVYLLIPGPRTAAAQALFEREQGWAAPILWRSELRNVLVGCMRRGELALEEAVALDSEAEDLMSANEYEMDSRAVLELTQRGRCSAYDCEYVALAVQLRTKLVTVDKQVLQAFPEVAVPLAID